MAAAAISVAHRMGSKLPDALSVAGFQRARPNDKQLSLLVRFCLRR